MLTDHRLLFVTGKGGVGKTTVAAALGLLVAGSGRRTLCVEMDGSGALSAVFGAESWEYNPAPTSVPDLFGMRMNTEDAMREYLRRYLPVPFLGRIGPLARSFDFIADAAPGVREVLSLGKLCNDIRDDRWDAIIVDAEATGHAISQLAAPKNLRELVKFGTVNDQAEWMAEMVADPDITAAVIVATPEEFAVTEAIELADRVVADAGVGDTSVVVNRVLPTMFNRRQSAVLSTLANDDALDAVMPDGVATVLNAARVIDARRQHGRVEIRRLSTAELSQVMVGECTSDDIPSVVVPHVAEQLAAEIGIEVDEDALAMLSLDDPDSDDPDSDDPDSDDPDSDGFPGSGGARRGAK